MQRGWRQAPFSGAQCQDRWQWAQTKTQEFPSECQEALY